MTLDAKLPVVNPIETQPVITKQALDYSDYRPLNKNQF
jgi:hypothetical protein